MTDNIGYSTEVDVTVIRPGSSYGHFRLENLVGETQYELAMNVQDSGKSDLINTFLTSPYDNGESGIVDVTESNGLFNIVLRGNVIPDLTAVKYSLDGGNTYLTASPIDGI